MDNSETQLAFFFKSLADDDTERLIIELVAKGLEPAKIVETLLAREVVDK